MNIYNENHRDFISRITTFMPELEIKQLELHQEGLVNDVAIVNNKLVFRFPKTEQAVRIQEVEMRILDLVRNRVDIDLPLPVYQSKKCVVYPLLEGESLTREIIQGLSKKDQTDLAGQLGRFLYQLHSTPFIKAGWELPSTLARVKREQWVEFRLKAQEQVYPLLLKHQVEWAERLFDSVLENPESFDYEPALIHGDLAPYHILYDRKYRRISGVIDFGVAGIGDAGTDIGILITTYGERFIRRMDVVYPDLDKLMIRARFYAQVIEFEWVLLGIETGEEFWFTAHLGSARDVG